jgi:hypothetical protein
VQSLDDQRNDPGKVREYNATCKREAGQELRWQCTFSILKKL